MWLAGGLVASWLVSENSRAVDRLLVQADPAATLRIKVLGAAETTLLLRYETAELTRHELQLWSAAQIGLGAFFLFFLLFGTSEGKVSLALSLVLLVCTLVQRFLVVPEIVTFGKLIDFLPAGVESGYRAKSLVMEATYFGIEVGKWIVIGVLTAILIGRGRGRSNRVWNQFNVVDKADHRHVDR